MGFYDEYKPFRNYMRRFELIQGLVDVWCYSQHVLNARPLPPDYAVGKPFGVTLNRNLWPWDLDILAREIVLNAGPRGDRSLRNWNHLQKQSTTYDAWMAWRTPSREKPEMCCSSFTGSHIGSFRGRSGQALAR
jgi:hypothetical protein